jgi:hypothetical protein
MAHAEIAVERAKKIKGIDKWQVERAAETLKKAFEIKSDTKLFDAAMVIINRDIENNIKVKGWAGGMKEY